MASRSLTFDIFAKDHDASGAFKKVGYAAESTGKHMGMLSAHFGHFGAAVRTGVGVAIGAAGIGGLVETFKGFYAEAVEAQKAGAQTAAVIKSTGGTAHISAKQIGDLATSISNKVGVDDEAIQSGENLLLTFTNVRNETGKGGDVFNQATRAIVDMTAGMNNGKISTEGLKASTIQVGKALNDPIKGMTALGKVGVTFTKQQKDQIALFIKHGHLAKAQGVILKELGKEFGGSAAASATAGQKLGVVWGNIKESIGTALLPTFTRVANWLADKIPQALQVATGWFAKGKVGVEALVSAFNGEGVTSNGFVGAMERIGVQARNAFETFKTQILPRLREFGSFLTGTVIPAVVSFGGWLVKIRGWLIPLGGGVLAVVAAIKVWAVVTKALAVAQAILNVVLDANPIGIIVLAIIGLAAAFYLAWKRSETFRNFVKAAIPILIPIVLLLVGPIVAVAAALVIAWKRSETFRNVVMGVFRAVAGGVLTASKFMLDAVLGFVIGALHAAGKMPGPLGAPFRSAEAAVTRFKDSADRKMVEALAAVDRFGRAAARPIRKDVTIRVVDRASGVLTTIQKQLDGISGRVVSATIFTRYGKVGENAEGTRNWPGGWSLVGEKGPELVHMPRGTDVYSHRESQSILTARAGRGPAGGGAAAGGGDTYNVYLTGPVFGDPNAYARKVEEALGRLKRTQGGRLAFQ